MRAEPEGGPVQVRGEASGGNNPEITLIIDIQPPGCEKTRVYPLSHRMCDTFSRQPQHTSKQPSSGAHFTRKSVRPPRPSWGQPLFTPPGYDPGSPSCTQKSHCSGAPLLPLCPADPGVGLPGAKHIANHLQDPCSKAALGKTAP